VDDLKVKMFTSGSTRWVYAEIVHPVRINLVKLGYRYGEYVYDTEFCTITINAHDSSRNIDREVVIKPKTTVVVRIFGSLSANKRFEEAYVLRPGREPEAVTLSLKIEKAVESGFEVTKEVGVANIDNSEVVVYEKVVGKKKLHYELKLRVAGNRVYVLGDTYEIRDKLKMLKFKFDPSVRAWYIENADIENIQAMLKSNIQNATIEI
jgi:hypothetical protein